jgi:hypothetical protein
MKYLIIFFSLIITGAAGFPAYGTELDDLKALVRQLQQAGARNCCSRCPGRRWNRPLYV